MLKDKIHITHLTFSGGGTHGSVLVGGLRFLYLEGLHKSVSHISCCSVGSFVALMFCFQFTIEEMEETIKSVLDSEKFSIIPKANYLKMFSNLGLTSTKSLTDHLIARIQEKYPELNETTEELENITFSDIAKRFGINLYIVATSLNTCQMKIFSIDDTPDAKVFEVCRASMSIPFLYQPVFIDGEYYVDGGMSNNFPIFLFDNIPYENKLGLALYSEIEQQSTIEKQQTKPNFFFVLQKVSVIIRNIYREKVFLCHLNRDYVLKYENIPAKWFDYELQKNGLKIFKMSEEQLNEMFIFGFHHMMHHFAEREKIMDNIRSKQLDIIDKNEA